MSKIFIVKEKGHRYDIEYVADEEEIKHQFAPATAKTILRIKSGEKVKINGVISVKRTN